MTEDENKPTNDENLETEGKVLTTEEAKLLMYKFVKFATDVEKKITLTNWKYVQKLDRFSETKVERVFLCADVTQEDGQAVEKVLDTSSIGLISKLMKVLDTLKPSDSVSFSITKTGTGFSTAYAVKQLK